MARISNVSRADRQLHAWRGLLVFVCILWPPAYAGDTALDILIYGASGEVGERLLNEALRRNHHVTAVSRDTSRIAWPRPHLDVVQGDLLDTDRARELTAGRDLVILSVRGAVGGSREPDQTIHLQGIRVLVTALRAQPAGKARLLIVGGAGSLEVRPGVTYAESIPRLFYLFVPRALRQEIAGHRLALEFLATVDDVHWTYVSPPKKLKSGPRTGNYRLGGNEMIYTDGRSTISMKDFAVAMLDLAEEGGHAGAHLSVVGDGAR